MQDGVVEGRARAADLLALPGPAGGDPRPVGPPDAQGEIRCSLVSAELTPDSASLLYDGTNTMFRCQTPVRPECTQCPAVHTRLEAPGSAGSVTAVPEQTRGPSGVSKNTFPKTAAFST